MNTAVRWPAWMTYAALAWSSGYAAVATYWSAGGDTYPFSHDTTAGSDYSGLLAGTDAAAVGPVMVGLSLAGIVVACLMLKTVRAAAPPPAALRWPALAFGVATATLLAVVLPESVAIKYMPPLGLLAFLRPPDWPTINILVLMVGGLLWAGATMAYWRAGRDACVNCGRTGRSSETGGTGRLDRWGRMATHVAVAAPLVYALQRLGWAVDIPIGVPQEFLDHINEANPGNSTRIMEVLLASFAMGGSVLTIGLRRPWGEIFPRWMPGLAGRRVPVAFPVGFAGLVACSVTAFAASLLRGLGPFFADGMVVEGFQMNLLYALPTFAFAAWGPALGVAAYAYYLRRRRACRHCGRGKPVGHRENRRSSPDAIAYSTGETE